MTDEPRARVRVAVVTGASSGIGRCLSELLSRSGYVTYGTCLSAAVQQLPFTMLNMDVRSESSVRDCIRDVQERHGRIDVLINNAGVSLVGAVEDTSPDELRDVFETNVFGPVRVINAVLPTMRQNQSGHVVNIGSIGGHFGLPFRTAYSASKAALAALTEGLCMELRPFGIFVTLVEPGDFRTRIHERRTTARRAREGTPYDQHFSAVAKSSFDGVENAPLPDAVADAALDALASVCPPIRVRVGNPVERLAVAAKTILPERWFQYLLLRYSAPTTRLVTSKGDLV